MTTSPETAAAVAVRTAAAAAARAVKVAAEAVKVASDLATQSAAHDRAAIAQLVSDSAAIRRAVLGERVDGVQTSKGLADDVKAMDARIKRLERGVLGLALLIPGAVLGGDSAANWVRGLFG